MLWATVLGMQTTEGDLQTLILSNNPDTGLWVYKGQDLTKVSHLPLCDDSIVNIVHLNKGFTMYQKKRWDII